MAQRKNINILKAFAIILVILGHCLVYYQSIQSFHNSIFDISKIIIYRVHVPLFFVISGYLCHEKPLSVFFPQKIKRILIPFFTFSVLKLLYSNTISSEFSHSSSIREQISDALLKGSLYWFCYCIFLFYLLAPVFWKLAKKFGPTSLLYSLILVILINSILYWNNISLTDFFQMNQVLYMLPFFLVGLLLQYSTKLQNLLSKYTQIRHLFIILIISILFIYLEFKKITPAIYAINFFLSLLLMYILFFISIFFENKDYKCSILQLIANYSYQLMLLDSFYKIILFKILGLFLPLNIVTVLFITLLDISLGCLTCIIIKHIPVINYLFGLQK